MEAFKAGTAPGEANAPAPDEGAPGTAANNGTSAPPSAVGEGTGGLY
jgi:hypothetical protein